MPHTFQSITQARLNHSAKTFARLLAVGTLAASLVACGGGNEPKAIASADAGSSSPARAQVLSAQPPVAMGADPGAPGKVGNFFVPYAMADIEAAETPISLAWLNDHVAGSRGQIRNVGGKLYAGSERIRLYGVGVYGGATMPAKADAVKLAARLRKEGFNAVRLFGWDAKLAVPNSWTVTHKFQGLLNEDLTLNAGALDYFDHFVYQLQQAGIYVLIPLHTSYRYKEAPDCIDFCEGLDVYLPELIQAHKRLSTALLNHVNPYTGRAYKNDPGVYAFEINNEDSMIHRWAKGTIDVYLTDPAYYPKYGAPLEAKWREWAQSKYGSAAAASAAWGVPLASFADLKAPLSRDRSTLAKALYRDWYDFHSGLDTAYITEMIGYLKNEVGVTTLVLGSQSHYQSMLSRGASDVSDFHTYFGSLSVAKGFRHSNGQPVFEVDNLSVLSYADPRQTSLFGTHQYKDLFKPNMISEYVTRMGSQYVAESEPLVSAYAGFQDVDAIFLTDQLSMNLMGTKMYYTGIWNASVSAVTRVTAALSFRRGDMAPGEPYVLKKTRDTILDAAAAKKEHNTTNETFGGDARAPLTRNMYQQVVDSMQDESIVKADAPPDGIYTTTTSQLKWKPLDRITVDTPMTKTAIGFFRNVAVDLGAGIQVSVGNTMNNYAVVQMTSLVKGAILPSSKMLLTLAGYFTVPGEYPRAPGAKLYSWGDDYPRIEAVPATVRITTLNTLKVSALDATGAKRFDVPVVAHGGYVEFVTGPAYDTGWYLIEVVGNSVPSATISAPAEVVRGAPVTLQALASDGDGSITKVEFFDGSTLIGTDTSAPYSVTWSPAVAGTRSLTARATDNLGAQTTSAPATVIVYASNTPPTVSWSLVPATAKVGVQTYVAASASDAGGRIVKVEFFDGDRLFDTDTTAPYSSLWTPLTGGVHTLTVRATDNLGAVTVSAPRTSTVSGGNAPPSVSLVAPSSGSVGVPLALSATAADSDGSIAKVEFYDGSTLIGTDTGSPYSLSWTPATAGTHVLTAKATDDKGAATTSAAENVVVSSANSPPTVSWAVLPATGTVGVPTYLSATASDSNGSIAKVEFYDGTTRIGTDTTAPYSMLWTPATPGQHSMTARATDNLGAVTVSAPRTSTVSGGNAAPSVSLVAPSSGSVGVPLTLGATATDSDGSIAKVEFFDGSTLIGTDTGSPYSLSWTPATAGTHVLTAKATDDKGAATTSAAENVVVSSANSPPTVSWAVLPATGTVGVPTYLSATASDSNGSIAKVEFYDGSTLIGTDTTSPYSMLWTPATPGQHSMTARATDNLGAVTVGSAKTSNIGPGGAGPTVRLGQ